MYLLQFQGHQVYFTPLLEYQLKKEGARPTFSITFYTDLMAEKNIVLMLGELSDKSNTLSLVEAQHLIYQLQIFYVTGSEKQKAMVHKFCKVPEEFSYEEQIASLQELSSNKS
jgi:ATP synthase mitochondrial F1 complex assembly factor 1